VVAYVYASERDNVDSVRHESDRVSFEERLRAEAPTFCEAKRIIHRSQRVSLNLLPHVSFKLIIKHKTQVFFLCAERNGGSSGRCYLLRYLH